MKPKSKKILAVVLLLLVGLTWIGWSTRPIQAPLDILWESPEERARRRLEGLPKVKIKFELSNVPLKEAVEMLNRSFENSSGQEAVVFRAWQEGDPVPKEMHRIKSIPVPDAATRMLESSLGIVDEDLEWIPRLVASAYGCNIAVSDDTIVFYPTGSFVSELVERQYYLLSQLGDPNQGFYGATRISEEKWDIRGWAAANGLDLSEDGFMHYEKSVNKLVVRAPRDQLILAGTLLSGSCGPLGAESPLQRLHLKAYLQWWRLKEKFFPTPPPPPMPAVPRIAGPGPAPSDGIPGLDPIPPLPGIPGRDPAPLLPNPQ